MKAPMEYFTKKTFYIYQRLSISKNQLYQIKLTNLNFQRGRKFMIPYVTIRTKYYKEGTGIRSNISTRSLIIAIITAMKVFFPTNI